MDIDNLIERLMSLTYGDDGDIKEYALLSHQLR